MEIVSDAWYGLMVDFSVVADADYVDSDDDENDAPMAPKPATIFIRNRFF
jgi:hypothetical protein